MESWGPALLALVVVAGSATETVVAQSTQPTRVALSWSGPGPECISAERLERRVEELLSRLVFDQSDPASVDLRIRGSALHSGDGWTLRFSAETPEGETLGVRELHQPRGRAPCEDLLGSAAVVVALTIDAASVEVHLELPPPQDAEPREPTSPVLEGRPLPRTSPADDEGTSLDLAVSLSAGATWGLLPGWAWAFESHTRVGLHELVTIGLDLSFSPPTSSGPGVGGTFLAYRARLGPCLRLVLAGPVHSSFCTLIELGVVTGSGQGAELTRSDERIAMAITPSAQVGIFMGPLDISLVVNLGIFPVAPRFVFQSPGEDLLVHEVSTVVPTFSLAVGLHTRE